MQATACHVVDPKGQHVHRIFRRGLVAVVAATLALAPTGAALATSEDLTATSTVEVDSEEISESSTDARTTVVANTETTQSKKDKKDKKDKESAKPAPTSEESTSKKGGKGNGKAPSQPVSNETAESVTAPESEPDITAPTEATNPTATDKDADPGNAPPVDDTSDTPVTTTPPMGEVIASPVVEEEPEAQPTGSISKHYDPVRDVVVVSVTCTNPTNRELVYQLEEQGGSRSPSTGVCPAGGNGLALAVEFPRDYVINANPLQEIELRLTIPSLLLELRQGVVSLADFGTPDNGGSNPGDGDETDGDNPDDGDGGKPDKDNPDNERGNEDARKNNPSYWEGVFVGADCFKLELNQPTFTVTADSLPQGAEYVAAVVKAGSSKSVENPNEVVKPIRVGQVLRHSSGKDISHVILCFQPIDDSNPGDGNGVGGDNGGE
ncbi:hypothetical protein CYG49_03905, partial [Candidatus Saccharibacteria bacterium]